VSRAVQDATRADAPREELVAMYRVMLLARALDERMWLLNRQGKAPFVISGQGHEGAQAGMVSVLRRDHDWLVPYYRSVTAVLAFGMTAREVMLGQFGRAADPSSGGRQMPSHWGHAERRIFTNSSPVATQVLHATGIALASKMRGLDEVTVTSLGEGSSNQGDFHEALNFAGVHRLPVIFVVENNGYAISVPSHLESAVEDIGSRGAGYGMPGVVVDGADVLACRAAMTQAVARARSGEGPSLLEAKVTRLTAHSSDDQQTRYRSAEELEAQRERDPLPRMREVLRSVGALDDATEEELAASVRAEVDDATDWAEAQPLPDPGTAELWVYADVPPARMDDPDWAGWADR
jgi:2-oxoisovalerate dehydrogenase E1 component alpha subunit